MRRSAPEGFLPTPRSGHYCGNAVDSQLSTINSQLPPMSLTPEQKQTVASWVAAGDNLSAVQKKLA